jgi:hypothetical protein
VGGRGPPVDLSRRDSFLDLALIYIVKNQYVVLLRLWPNVLYNIIIVTARWASGRRVNKITHHIFVFATFLSLDISIRERKT